MSKLTPELSDYQLSFMNFEWLANSGNSERRLHLQNGIVKIPIHFDDYHLFTGRYDYREWEAEIFEHSKGEPIFGFGLHDCYAGKWLDQYPDILNKLSSYGRFATADEICDQAYVRAVSELPDSSEMARPNLLARVRTWLTA